MVSDQTSNESRLNVPSRWCAVILGLILLGASSLLLYVPPVHQTIEHDANDKQVKRVSTQGDLSSAFVAVALAGVGLLLFGLNGYRFSRFSAGGVSAEADAVTKEAKRQLTDQSNEPTPIKIDKESEPEPQTTQPAAGSVTADGDEYAIYELGDIPFAVVRDALASWPAEQSKPSTLGDFEYASKKKGRGNNAWQLKFRGQPPVVLTYGGYGKSTPTVNPA